MNARWDGESPLILTDLVIRHVTKADLPALEWGGAYTTYRRMYADLFRDSKSGRVILWMVARPPVEMIGQTFVLLRSEQGKIADGRRRAYLFAIRVKPAWRNQGVGSYLIRFVESDLYQRGFRYATLNVAKENIEAQRFYQHLGYQIIGTSPGIWSYTDHEGHIQHVNEPAWRMMKTLHSPD